MKRIKGLCCLLCLVFVFGVAAQESPQLERRKDILRYGIESEILDLVTTLQSEKNDQLNPELLSVLAETHNPKLRQAILNFFSAREWPGAIQVAVDIVDHRDQDIASSTEGALKYLSTLRAKEGVPEAREIIAAKEDKYQVAAVRLLGRAGGEAEAEILIGLFDSDETSDALKQETILALGEIKAAAAVESLIEILGNESAGKATRMYAADALGKIGDARAVPPLIKAANGDDPQVRGYAVSALGSFAATDSQTAIVQALRDGVPAVRVAAIKSSALLRIQEAEPYLRYRARNDPDKKVREEALKAIGEFGGKENIAFLQDFIKDKKSDSGSRIVAFSVLIDTDVDGSRRALEEILTSQAAEKDTTLYKALLGALAGTDQIKAAPLVEKYLLKSEDFTARIAGIDWVRKNKSETLRPVVGALAESDPVESVKRRAAAALSAF